MKINYLARLHAARREQAERVRKEFSDSGEFSAMSKILKDKVDEKKDIILPKEFNL